MPYDIPLSDLELILKTLATSDDPEVTRARKQLEGQDLVYGLKKFDPPKDFRDHIQRLCHYLREQFEIRDWNGSVQFESPPGETDFSDRGEVRASIKINDVYCYYTIRISPCLLDSWFRKEYRTIAENLCHEFTHILTHPLVRWAKNDAAPSQIGLIEDVDERQTQKISTIIGVSLPDGWWKPERLVSWCEKNGVKVREDPVPQPES